ncbi:MAG: Rieske 2Fe-2S domain-containing protein [Candidatus Melainabacteria bacterium]|nr:Rieske 2Fe-2S domain-containing protein [Candidatus Melainabacteria bacterium]
MDPSRRNLLKLLAGAPLLLTAGFAGEALMRFAKPSMKAGGIFDPADEPELAIPPLFSKEYFPEPWTCLPFMYTIKYKIFNPENEEIRSIPAFIVRLNDDRIHAYSRECPRGRGCILNFVKESIRNCGCGTNFKKCCCNIELNNPALVCCCHMDVYDLANDGACVRGPSPRRPKKIEVFIDGEQITVGRMENLIV